MSAEELRKHHRIVVLDSPYDVIEDRNVARLFGLIARLKVMDYAGRYPRGVIPFDALDLVTSHYMLCEMLPDGPEPVIAFKMLSAELCARYRQENPAFKHVPRNRHPRHNAAVETAFDSAHARGISLGYPASWTIRRDVRPFAGWSEVRRELTGAMLYWACQRERYDALLAIAVTRFKVEAFHEAMGFRRMADEAGILPGFASPEQLDEVCSLTYLDDARSFSPATQEWAAKHRDLWDGRLEFRPKPAPR